MPRVLADTAIDLTRRLGAISARTFVYEMHSALPALRGRDRFAEFLGGVDLRALLTRYPVLARVLAQTCLRTAAATAELLDRFGRDRAVILDLVGGDPGPLVRVRAGAGDRHRGGRSVTLLEFADGRGVVYQPRPVELHARFGELVGWLDRHVRLDLRTAACAARPGYGWVERIDHAPCRSAGEVELFYRRQGALLALLYALDATDIHHENLIAAGGHPVLVDVETLFHPAFPAPSATGPDPAEAALAASAARTALLPIQAYGEGGVLDVSGLGAAGGEYPVSVSRWVDAGTERMRLERVRVPFVCGDHRPVLDGHPADPGAHLPALLDGFRSAYAAISGRRAEFGGLLARCADAETRVVLRHTHRYADLLIDSTHPDLLRSHADRDRLFNLLRAEPVGVPDAVEHEVAQLWAGDVPTFHSRPASRHIWTGDGTCLPHHLPRTGLRAATDKLARMGVVDRRAQEWIIKAAFATRGANVSHTYVPAAGDQSRLRPEAAGASGGDGDRGAVRSQDGAASGGDGGRGAVRSEAEAASGGDGSRVAVRPEAATASGAHGDRSGFRSEDPAESGGDGGRGRFRSEAGAASGARGDRSRFRPEEPATSGGRGDRGAVRSGAGAASGAHGDRSGFRSEVPAASGGCEGRGRFRPEAALDAAVQIAEDIAGRAVRGRGRVNWLGVEPVDDRFWSLLPMGAGLLHGYTGVALFLDQVGRIADRPDFRALAADAITPVEALLNRLTADPGLTRMAGGGMAGIAGIAYALAHLGHPDLAATTLPLLATTDSSSIHDGMAGALLACVSIGTPEAQALASTLADRLAALVRSALGDGASDQDTGDGQSALDGVRVPRARRGGSESRSVAAGSGRGAGVSGGAGDRPGGAVGGAGGAGGAVGGAGGAVGGGGSAGAGGSVSGAGVAGVRRSGVVGAGGACGARVAGVAGLGGAGFLHGAAGVGHALVVAGREEGVWALDAAVAAGVGDAGWCAGWAGIALACAHAGRGVGFDAPGGSADASLCHGEIGVLTAVAAYAGPGDPRLDALTPPGRRGGAPSGIATPGLLVGSAGIGHGLLHLAFPDQVPPVLLFAAPMQALHPLRKDDHRWTSTT
ncbi:type 2 lanthipeptide synthetase LanM [Actinokineospora sp. NPDC004072]